MFVYRPAHTHTKCTVISLVMHLSASSRARTRAAAGVGSPRASQYCVCMCAGLFYKKLILKCLQVRPAHMRTKRTVIR